MEALQNFALEKYEPKRFEEFLKGLKAPISKEDNQRITDTFLNPMSFLLTPVNAKGMVTMISDGKGGNLIPAYTTVQEAMKNISFDPGWKMIPCSVAMYANMMEQDEKVTGVAINFVESPGQIKTGMALGRENILELKEPYLRIVKAYRELEKHATMAPVSLFAPDEVLSSQIRVSVTEILKRYDAVKTCHVCRTTREINGEKKEGLLYVVEGEMNDDTNTALKDEMTSVSRSFIPEAWLVEIVGKDTELGRKVMPGTVRFY